MEELPLCECGCGERVTKPGNRFIHGHNTRWEWENDPIASKNRRNGQYEVSQTPEFSRAVSIGTKKALQKPETKKKNRDRMIKRYKDPEERRRHSEKLKIARNTPESRAKNSRAQKERFKDPKEVEKNRRAAEINWATPGKKEHISKILKTWWKDPEYRDNQSQKRKEWWSVAENWASRCGINSPNWQGGIQYEPYCPEFSDIEYREWLKERDNYTCQNPYCRQNSTPRLHLHHINHVKKDCQPDNFIVTCTSCNGRANYHKSYWRRLYQRIRKHGFNPILMFEH